MANKKNEKTGTNNQWCSCDASVSSECERKNKKK